MSESFNEHVVLQDVMEHAVNTKKNILDFKLSPCFESIMYSIFKGWMYIQPLKMEPIEGSETSAYNNQTPGKHPKEYIIDSVMFPTEC